MFPWLRRHIAPFAIDFFKQGELRKRWYSDNLPRNFSSGFVNEWLSVSLRWKRNQGCCCGFRQFRKRKQGSLRGQMQPCVHNPRSFVWRSSAHDSHTLKNKIEAIFIDEVAWWSALCGEIVFYPFHLYIVRKRSVIYYFSFSFFSSVLSSLLLSSTAFSLIFHTYVHVKIEVVQYCAKVK